ncbi:MAG: dihydroneopterin aldolase [Pseudoxanthomonas sp.]
MGGDIVFIEALAAQALIGVYPHERGAPQPLSFDVELEVDTRRAGGSDALADTVDYAAVAAEIQALCAASSYALVEALAEAVAARLLAVFPVRRVMLRIGKPQAVPQARTVGVRIVRSR